MYHFNLKVTGHIVGVETQYIRSRAICRDYLSDETPEFNIRVSQADIEKERETCIHLSGDCTLWDSTLETIALHALVSAGLIDYGVFLMHGAAVEYDHHAYVFSAKSGTGKTTHALQWLRHLPQARIINGDKPLIATGEDGSPPLACGSPWAGKENMYTNTMVPIRAIVLMERAEENRMERITFAQAFPFLLQQVYRPEDEEKMRQTLRLMQRLKNVAFYRFHCNNFRDDCFDVAYHALVEDEA